MKKYKMFKLMIFNKELSLKKVFNFGRNYFKYLTKNTKISGFPSVLMIESTNFCNLSYPLCPTGNKTLKAPQGYMDFDNYKKIIDKIGDYIVMLVLYNFGEPFLHKKLLDMVEYAKKKNIFIRLSTNGHFLNDKPMIRRLVKTALDHLIIALDGASQKTLQKYRKGADFNKVIKGIHLVEEVKNYYGAPIPYTELQFVVMSHNEKEIPTIKKIAKKIRINNLKLKTVVLSGYSGEEKKEMMGYLPKDKKYIRYEIEPNKIKQKIINKCVWLWLGMVINWDGSVVPCCYDPNRTIELGNTLKNNIERIWKSERYRRFRKTILHNKNSIEICKECPGTFTGKDI